MEEKFEREEEPDWEEELEMEEEPGHGLLG